MSHGSQQLRMYRIARRAGVPMEQAIIPSGMTEWEGKHWDERDAANPPPEEAYQLLYDPDAKGGVSSQKDERKSGMASAAKKEDGEGSGITGEYSPPNVEQAFKIYDTEIAPKEAKLSTIRGDMSEPHKRIKDDCHFPRQVLNFIIALENMEDSKRDHHLLALHGALRHRQLFLPSDLVTQAQGEAGGDVVSTGERRMPKLATAGGINVDDDFDEATEEELAKQEPRLNKPSADLKMKSVDSDLEKA